MTKWIILATVESREVSLNANNNSIPAVLKNTPKTVEKKVVKPIVDANLSAKNEEKQLRSDYYNVVGKLYWLKPGETFNVWNV